MNANDVKQIIESNFGWIEFQRLLFNQPGNYTANNEFFKEFNQKTNLNLHDLTQEEFPVPQDDGVIFNKIHRWKFNNQWFQPKSTWDSWNGINVNIKDFVEVMPKQISVTIYEEVIKG